ncbi:unnamed protein product, partial [Rotaria magnacalcarata]
MLSDLLANWRATEARLNIQESDIFLKIVLVFVHAVEHTSPVNANADLQRVKDLVVTKTLLDLLR